MLESAKQFILNLQILSEGIIDPLVLLLQSLFDLFSAVSDYLRVNVPELELIDQVQ